MQTAAGQRMREGPDELDAIDSMDRNCRWKCDLVASFPGSRTLEVGYGTALVLERLTGSRLLPGIETLDPDTARRRGE